MVIVKKIQMINNDKEINIIKMIKKLRDRRSRLRNCDKRDKMNV